VKNATGKLM